MSRMWLEEQEVFSEGREESGKGRVLTRQDLCSRTRRLGSVCKRLKDVREGRELTEPFRGKRVALSFEVRR